MLVIAMTGGIASGKSTVANRLRELGAVVLDADQLAREVVEPGQPALEEIRRTFGDEVITPEGRLDRPALAKIIFSDTDRRQQLEAIVHPRIRQRMKDDLDRLRTDPNVSVVICDIPLLFETGMSLEPFDRVLVVWAPVEQQIQRLKERNGLTAEESRARIAAQWPTEEKVKRADDVIDNSKDLPSTLHQVDQLWQEWMRLISEGNQNTRAQR